jgi:type 1 glutamine amidotransferase
MSTAPALLLAALLHGRQPAVEPVPVLIVTGENNHDWRYTTVRIREALESCGRFLVDVTEDPIATFSDSKAITKYRCFVLNYYNAKDREGFRWGEPAESNFLGAVLNGTGVSVVHAANNAFPGWSDYEKLVGDLWRDGTGHGAYHAFDVKMVDRNHPITRDMPDLIQHTDELYHDLVRTPGVNVRVLATAFSAKEKGGTGEDEPMAMVLEFGKGRVFHTPLGHTWPGAEGTKVTWDDPAFLILLARGTEWAATGAVTIPPVPVNELTFSERQLGFRQLFDGRSTKGWRGFRRGDFPSQGWDLEGGTLHVKPGGGGGDIVTADEFSDFELRFQWKVTPGANSGVIYRAGEELDAPWQTGPEYQVLDDAAHPDGKDPRTSAASLYALYEPREKALQPVGGWNDARILVRAGHVEHWLNGKKVVECELGSDDWKARVAASKFAAMAQFGTLAKGRIALQDHGDEVWYRSIRIRELSPPPAGG